MENENTKWWQRPYLNWGIALLFLFLGFAGLAVSSADPLLLGMAALAFGIFLFCVVWNLLWPWRFFRRFVNRGGPVTLVVGILMLYASFGPAFLERRAVWQSAISIFGAFSGGLLALSGLFDTFERLFKQKERA